MNDYTADLAEELAQEDFLVEFETLRDEQKYQDMHALFVRMEYMDYGDLVRELKSELNDTELALLDPAPADFIDEVKHPHER